MTQPSLFDPPGPTPAERQAALDALPRAPIVRERIVPTASKDPIGHLASCQDTDCRECPTLRLDFAQCSCGRWQARQTMYSGKCDACHLTAHGVFDGRLAGYFWRPGG